MRSVNPAVAAREGLDISVLAVVFDDGSGDGDEKAVAAILDERQKSKLRLTRIIDLLNGDLSSSRAINDTVVDELRSRISSLATGPEDSSEVNDVLRWLGELDQRLSPRGKIVRVKEICENLAARL